MGRKLKDLFRAKKYIFKDNRITNKGIVLLDSIENIIVITTHALT
jgi:hypothetical protein